jgi:hypothetical protein
MASTKISTNFLLEPKTRNQLEELAKEAGCSWAQIVRTQIRLHWLMVFKQAPLCANGSKCLVPQIHEKPARPD